MSPVEQQLQFEMHQCRSAFLYVNSSVLKKKTKKTKPKHIVLLHSTKCVLVCTAGLVSYDTFARSKNLWALKHSTGASHPPKLWTDGCSLSLSLLISIAPESSLLCSFEDGNEGFDYYGKKSIFSFSSSFQRLSLRTRKKNKLLHPDISTSVSLSLWFPGWGAAPASAPAGGPGSPWGFETRPGPGPGSPPWGTGPALVAAVAVEELCCWARTPPRWGCRAWAPCPGTSTSPARAGRRQRPRAAGGRRACRAGVVGVEPGARCSCCSP